MSSDIKKKTDFTSNGCVTLGLAAFKRTVWLPVVWSVLVIVMTVIGTPFYRVFSTPESYTIENLIKDMTSLVMSQYAVSIMISAVFGAMQFSYLTKNSSVGFIHSLPVNRRQIFFSYYLSGVVTVLIPQAAMALVCLAIDWQYRFLFPLIVFAVGAVYSVGVYSFGVMMSFFSANTVGCVVFTGFGLATPAIIESFIRDIMESRLYGYYNTVDLWISEYIYLLPEGVLSARGLIYAAAIVLFTSCAYILFVKRPSESAGDLIAFPGIRGIATVICSILAGIYGYLIFGRSFVSFAIFGVICGVLVNFVIKKRFDLKTALIHAGVVAVTAFVIFSVFTFDITGFERRVPKTEDIESVKFYPGYRGNDVVYYVGGQPLYRSDDIFRITDKEGIDAVRDFHTAMLDHRKDTMEASHYPEDTRSSGSSIYDPYSSENFVIVYELKNGSTMYRTYTASYGRDRDALVKVLSRKQVKAYEHPIIRDDVKPVFVRLYGPFGEKVLTKEETLLVWNALRQDILALEDKDIRSVNNYRSYSLVNAVFETEYTELYDSDGKPVSLEKLNKSSFDVNEVIYAGHTNTLKVLSELGYGELFEFAEIPEDYGVEVIKHFNDGGEMTDVYAAVSVDDDELAGRMLKHSYSLSSELLTAPCDTAYELRISKGKNTEVNSIMIYGKVDLIEEWLSDKKLTLSTSYKGKPYEPFAATGKYR